MGAGASPVQNGTRAPRAGVSDSCELCDKGARNLATALRQYVQSEHLCSPAPALLPCSPAALLLHSHPAALLLYSHPAPLHPCFCTLTLQPTLTFSPPRVGELSDCACSLNSSEKHHLQQGAKNKMKYNYILIGSDSGSIVFNSQYSSIVLLI